MIELLSVRAPFPDVKLNLLKEVAEEHGLDWDPDTFETEFFKPHKDLPNDPTQFVSGLNLHFPKEKHDESLHSDNEQIPKEEDPNFDVGLDPFDFPENDVFFPQVFCLSRSRSGSGFKPTPLTWLEELKKREKKDVLAIHASHQTRQEALKDDHDAFTIVIGSLVSVLHGEYENDRKKFCVSTWERTLKECISEDISWEEWVWAASQKMNKKSEIYDKQMTAAKKTGNLVQQEKVKDRAKLAAAKEASKNKTKCKVDDEMPQRSGSH
ncbi:hypothetical protein AAG906_035905 [Vitis piasezkii]